MNPPSWLKCCFTVRRNRSFIRDGSPGRPPRLSHTSRALNPPLHRTPFYSSGAKQVNMVLNVHRNRTAYERRGEGGGGVWRWGEREIIYLSLHCHHQHDSCIKMGSDESYFNVSLIVRDKVTRQCPETTIFEQKGEPKQIRTEVPLLTSLTLYN